MVLSCDADGKPNPTLSWTRNGSPLGTSDNSNISISEDSKQLTITNVSRTDCGEYRCVASNSLGNASSNAALLNVQCKIVADVVCNFSDLFIVGTLYILQFVHNRFYVIQFIQFVHYTFFSFALELL